MQLLTTLTLTAAFFSSFTVALLDKPALHPDLDYLESGSENNLHPVQSSIQQWGAGWIPKDCYDIAKSYKFDPKDVQTFNVKYTDCSEAWTLCYHKNSPNTLIHIIDLFGRVPVRMRSYVRHVITLPAQQAWAFESNQNIAVFGLHNDGGLDVMLHETGHALDFGGAYPGTDAQHTFHDTKVWMDNYNQDPDVPDNYARTNIVEDVAQVTVVSVFDKVVPGGFGTVEKGWNKIFHQYATLEWQAGNKIIPGGTCSSRLANSAAVPQSGASSRIKAREKLAEMPDVSFSSKNITILPGSIHSTEKHCKGRWA